MESLTPFIRHALDDKPGPSGASEASCSRCSPPLGKEPSPAPEPSAPAEQPGQTPHPGPESAPRGQNAVPMTDGTPAACYQKNADAFLAGETDTSVMAHYAPGLFSTQQHTHSRHPAPDSDTAAVQALVEWREESPYG